MRGFTYFLSVVVAVLGLSLAVRFIYSNNPLNAGAPVAVAAESPATSGAVPAGPVVDSIQGRAALDTGRRAPSADRGPVAGGPERDRPVRRLTSTTPGAAPAADTAAVPRPAADSAPVPAPPTPEPAPVVPAWQATPRQVARDSAFVMVSSGRLSAAIAVLDAWMQQNPTDTAVGLDLARLKARAGDWQGSIAQYSALIEQYRSAPFLFERGQTYLWSGDSERGEADLLASEALSAHAATERQLGDLYRWRGDFAQAARWYRLAARSAPGDTSVINSTILLDRALEARLRVPGELSGGDAGSRAEVITDNAGFEVYSLRVGQAVRLPAASTTVMSVSGELRSTTRSASGAGERLTAWGVDVSLASRLGASKFAASVGRLDHGALNPVIRGFVSADVFVGATRVRASWRRSPAYETLWAPRMFGIAGTPSTTWSTQGSVSWPLGSSELYAMGEFLSVSDDNTRRAFQLAGRRRLAGPFSLLYAGSLMAYERQTALYYSPARYLSQALGLEWARYRDQGLSFALRASPGYAWMREPAGIADSTTRDLSAFQFTSGFELGYRREAWDLLLATGLSAGREGGYRSQNALLMLRRAW
ncbi:MAG TPA: hypothetical protein VFZ73_11800 [Gemmatimonadaceae bacterium]